MGLSDDIQTLRAHYKSGGDQGDGHRLAKAIAEMIGRKSSKEWIWGHFEDLQEVLNELGRYDELIEVAAGGVDPVSLGAWDCQEAVGLWLEKQP